MSVSNRSIRIVGPGFIGGHPMAGFELGGFEHARADLFRGAIAVLTRLQATRESAIDTVTHLWKMTGAEIVSMSAEQRDETVTRKHERRDWMH